MLLWLNGAAGQTPPLDFLMRALAQWSPYLYPLFFVALWLFLPKTDPATRRVLITAGVAAVIAVLVSIGIGHLVYRARPFVALPHLVHMLVHHAPDSSLPSDHATFVAAIAATTMMLRRRRWISWVCLIGAVGVGVARVYVGVHWPTDVLAGAVVGLVVAHFVWRFRAPIDRLSDWLMRALRLAEPDPGPRPSA